MFDIEEKPHKNFSEAIHDEVIKALHRGVAIEIVIGLLSYEKAHLQEALPLIQAINSAAKGEK